MIKKKVFDIPIYGRKIVFIACDDPYQLTKKISSWDDEVIHAHCFKEVYFKKWNAYYIIINPFKKYDRLTKGTIAHECYHCINFICFDKGIELQLNNDEAQAYLMGWLTDKIWDCLIKWKIHNLIK